MRITRPVVLSQYTGSTGFCCFALAFLLFPLCSSLLLPFCLLLLHHCSTLSHTVQQSTAIQSTARCPLSTAHTVTARPPPNTGAQGLRFMDLVCFLHWVFAFSLCRPLLIHASPSPQLSPCQKSSCTLHLANSPPSPTSRHLLHITRNPIFSAVFHPICNSRACRSILYCILCCV